MILASTSAAMGVKTARVRDVLGPPGLRQGPEADHGRELDAEDALRHAAARHQPSEALEDELPGHGPVDDGPLAKQYDVASPKELLAIAQEMGVEFIPCQMTMDMFGLTPDDMIEGMSEPVGAATVIGLMTDNSVPLFI